MAQRTSGIQHRSQGCRGLPASASLSMAGNGGFSQSLPVFRYGIGRRLVWADLIGLREWRAATFYACCLGASAASGSKDAHGAMEGICYRANG